jgi:division protein CdvB (Snf7/Vps24/ESCRT-III family)
MNFDRSWAKKRKSTTSEKIKEKVRAPEPLKPRVEFAKNRIQTQSQKLDTVLTNLKDKEKVLFSQVVSNLQKHDVQKSKMLSNELAQTKRTAKMISQMKLAVEQVNLRLESTISMGDAVESIAPAIGALTRVKSGLAGTMPDVDSQLGEINGVFNEVMSNMGSIGSTSFDISARSEDIETILSEASAVAEQRMNENLPDVPIGSFSSGSSSRRRSSLGEHSQ